MPGPSLLHRRNGSDRWYVRVQVPTELQSVLKKSEIWRSLGTSERKLAAKLAPAKVAEILQDIERQRAAAPRSPSRSDLEDAVRRFYADEVESDLHERTFERDLTQERLKRNPVRYRVYAESLQTQLAQMDYSHVLDDAEFLLNYEAFSLAVDDPLYGELLQQLMRARLEAARRWSEHDQGLIGEEPRDNFFKTPASARAVASSMPKVPPLPPLFERYALARRDALKPNTIDDSRKTVLRFSEFVGMARSADMIERAEARTWRDLLRDWPQYANQASEFHGLDFKRVLEANKRIGRAPISLRTANKYLADLSTFFECLMREDFVKVNIFAGLTFERRKDGQTTYPFSRRQLDHLVQSPLLTACVGTSTISDIARRGTLRTRDWRYWILLLAMFTGGRQGEIAQLEVADIAEEDGIPFLHITNMGEVAGKSIKAANSRRRVPIHSMLIDLGFLEFVAVQRATGKKALFPDIGRDSRGYHSAVSKFYQKYFDAIGLRSMEPVSTTFHSLRHNFIDELRLSFPQDDTFKSLIGHAGRSVTSGYGIREVLGLRKRRELVESVTFQGVDLSALFSNR